MLFENGNHWYPKEKYWLGAPSIWWEFLYSYLYYTGLWLCHSCLHFLKENTVGVVWVFCTFYQRNNFIFFFYILPHQPVYVRPNSYLCCGMELSTSQFTHRPLNFAPRSHMLQVCILGRVRANSCFSLWRLVYICCSSCDFTPWELCFAF